MVVVEKLMVKLDFRAVGKILCRKGQEFKEFKQINPIQINRVS
jgi:hypothetical protein